MKQNAGIIREETRLQNGLKRILELKKEFYSKDNILKEFKIENEGVVLTLEVKSSLVVSEAIIRSALIRRREVEALTTDSIFQNSMTKNGRSTSIAGQKEKR